MRWLLLVGVLQGTPHNPAYVDGIFDTQEACVAASQHLWNAIPNSKAYGVCLKVENP